MYNIHKPLFLCSFLISEPNLFQFSNTRLVIDRMAAGNNPTTKQALEQEDVAFTEDSDMQQFQSSSNERSKRKRSPSPQNLQPLRKSSRTPKRAKKEDDFIYDDVGTHNNHHKTEKQPECRPEIIQCSICDKDFKSRKGLVDHMASHNTPLPCPNCDQSFKNKEILSLHQLIHGNADDDGILEREGINFSILPGKRPFGCVLCHKEFTSFQSLKYHSKEHQEEKNVAVFKCDDCGKGYHSKPGLRYHVKHSCPLLTGIEKTQKKEQSLACTVCDKVFKSRAGLRYHLKTVHEENNQEDLPSCTICGKIYQSKPGLRYHLKFAHTVKSEDKEEKEEKMTGTCHICGLTFRESFILELHHTIVHTEEPVPEKYANINILPGAKAFGCPKCDKTYTILSSLRFHENIHNGIKPYKCDHCDSSFLHRSSLKYHVKADHKEPMNIVQCQHCDKVFRTLSQWKEHQSAHGKQSSYQCDVCQRSFSRLQSLKEHKARHDPVVARAFAVKLRQRYRQRKEKNLRRFICKLCGKRLSCKFGLTQHLLAHSGEKPYTCEQCGKSFKSQMSIKLHQLSHTGEKPHKCQTCEKKFKLKSSLQAHRLRHETEVERQQCPFCNKNFPSNNELMQHTNTSHAGAKPHCTKCPRKFEDEAQLQKHMQWHMRSG